MDNNIGLMGYVERFAAAMKLSERHGNDYGDMDAANNAWHECKKYADEIESLRVQLNEANRNLAVARDALESCRGNINPERGYCDEVEQEITDALAEIESAARKEGE